MKTRKLTPLEYMLALKVFKSSINYNLVKIHDYAYIFFQPKNSGMTPNGEIYLYNAYKEDFGLERPAISAFFIHEMAHVWQYQNKILHPITAAISETIYHFFDYAKAYRYTLDGSKDLRDYKIEQQASIIEDYFRTNFVGLLPTPNNLQNNYAKVKKDRLYEKVLAKFIENPSY